MKYTNARFSVHDNVLSVLYLSLLDAVLRAEGFTMLGYSGNRRHLADERRRINPKEYLNVLERSLSPAVVATGVGFQYGKLLNIAGAGTVGQLLMSCATLGEVLQNFLKYYPLLSLSMQFDVSHTGGICKIEAERIYKRDASLPVQWFLTESLFNCWITQCSWLTGQPLKYQKVTFKYPAPPHRRLYEACFGCEIEFDAPANSVTVPKSFFSHKVLTANEPVRIAKERYCWSVLMRWQSLFSIQEQINTWLEKAMPDIPSLEAMARQLNMSRSSLYRRLRDAGCSYQIIVDKFRRDKSIFYLTQSTLTISEIADRLGFSDASNFRRAFKKWTANTPSELRLRRRAVPHLPTPEQSSQQPDDPHFFHPSARSEIYQTA